ncbi:MAG: heme A synthase, partial [Rhodospirillaceae bacterium]|nr:heme A synthase [Rhodospirillaceae bacterium]
PEGRARLAVHAVLATALTQVGLGIATLLLVVPVSVAALHQAGALVLLSALIWAGQVLRGQPD